MVRHRTGHRVIEADAPRVFVSHATEDKARFVLPFAEQLRARGVDAWVDQWEMLDGDSLVGKIFPAIDQAAAVIVVLSRVSITKPWVTEELDSAVVKRINTGSRLIPIVLDGLTIATEVPASVRHLRLRIVADVSDLAAVLDPVVRSIFGDVERPPLGARPRYASAPAVRISGLDRIDSLVLRAAGAEAIRDDGDRFATDEFVATVMAELGITSVQAAESLDVLDASRFIRLSRRLSGTAPWFDLTAHGLRTHLRNYEPEWPRWEATVVARLAAWPEEQGTERDLAAAAGDVPRVVARMMLERLDRQGLRISKVNGPAGWRFHSISPLLRRRADR